ncbi:FeS assembly protein SufD [Candidatus Mancarchaeum acidiphilum]|uniref:FeS assembly protein SufD n=1 Tax=Candidatus Mancarchaeum acidiphilum TaxID=1920749 RepID=A0A218NNQ5_9ARCH|nr:SufD family Fe-S cluster assembly protein [Candidatus Mancarchaeum acidiphilum]ASI14110.1 FeS assembly protein SufD [Candidatus Mancarchaeum acidiphilum]
MDNNINNYQSLREDAISMQKSGRASQNYLRDILYKKYNFKIQLLPPNGNAIAASSDYAKYESILGIKFNVRITGGLDVVNDMPNEVEVYTPGSFNIQRKKLFDNSDLYAAFVHAFSEKIIYIRPKAGKPVNIILDYSHNLYPIQLIIDSSSKELSTINEIILSGKSDDLPPAVIMHEVSANKDSSLEFNIMHLGGDSGVVSMLRANADEYSKLDINEIYAGNSFTKEESRIVSAAESAEVNIRKTVAGSMNQKFDLMSDLVNAERNTKCDSSLNVIASGSSVCYAKDFAEVREGAEKSVSHISQRGIIRDSTASLNMMPDMSINESYTKASHYSYSSPIDKDELFYLESRGMSEEQAEHLISLGFFSTNVGKIRDREVRNSAISILDYVLSKRDYHIPKGLKPIEWDFYGGMGIIEGIKDTK